MLRRALNAVGETVPDPVGSGEPWRGLWEEDSGWGKSILRIKKTKTPKFGCPS